ncbi:MAG: SUMF1/EgtB/PvdO family nonheme iron enzyme [Chloroflexi bacterium]|nr:SUMF1/EgtB/PvdO family nonheme iron enzyme [Chloroflexota bacterium]
MPREPKQRKTEIQNVRSERDVIFGDQITQTDVDLTRVEGLLAQIVGALQNLSVKLTTETDAHERAVHVITTPETTLRVTRQEVALLGGALGQIHADHRQAIYLIRRFLLDDTYLRWDQRYVRLRGSLPEPQLRMSDTNDPGISAAGIIVEDVRDAITKHDKTRAVILGEPGAGKTTTLERLALDLALQMVRDPRAGKLPVWIDLSKFDDAHAQPAEFLQKEWELLGLNETYGQAVNRGRVCFLLDGVNQMPYDDRALRIDRWANWANRELPKDNWAVFTCRTDDYDNGLRLPQVKVQRLDRERMRQYLELRFGAERAVELWADFDKRLHSHDDRFEKLARNPMFLALIADRCEQGKPFAENRAHLLQDLAARRVEHELRDERVPREWLNQRKEIQTALLDNLSRIAYAIQAGRKSTAFGAEFVEQVLAAVPAPLTAAQTLELAAHANLLTRGEDKTTWTFWHHLLLEYFAARRLLQEFRAGKNLSNYWRAGWRTWDFMPKRYAAGERVEPPPTNQWEETVMLAASQADEDAPRFIETVRRDNLPLAGRCLAEAGVHQKQLAPLAEQTRAALLKRQRDAGGHLRARIGAGLALGELGHPELAPQKFECEGRAVWAILPPMELVPAGEFVRGSDAKDKRAYRDENTTQRKIALPAFEIGRYPVTNAEFQFFVQDGGYRNDRWWSDAGKQWKQGGADAHASAAESWLYTRKILNESEEKLEERAKRLNWTPQIFRFWNEFVSMTDEQALARAQQMLERPFDRPGYWDDRDLSSPGRPVVGVNWHEAEAYCNWLSRVTGKLFRLPTEMEWEKSARGTDGREYPWGETFDSKRCNSVESHIYTTTPIGLYPDGISPFKILDASGNVLEWTGSWYQMYDGGESNASSDFGEKYRVIRGGSFNFDRSYVRCARRYRDVAVNFNNNIGFRLLCPGS